MCYLISACSDVSEPASKCQHVLVAPQNALLNISAPRTAAAGCLLPPSPPPPGPAASQALLWVLSSKKSNTPFAMLECCWLLHPEREPSHFNVHLYLQLIRWSKVFIWSRFGGAFQLFFPQLKTWPSLIRVLAQARVKFMFEFWHLGQNSEIWVTFSPKRLAVNHTLLHVWSQTDGGGCQEQFRVLYLTQGPFDMQTKGYRTSDLLVTRDRLYPLSHSC